MGFITNTCLWLYGRKEPPLLVSKSIFFRRAAEDNKLRWALHPEHEQRGKSSLLVLSLPFSATLEGTHLCKQMAAQFCDAAQQQLVCEEVLGAAGRDEQLQSTW